MKNMICIAVGSDGSLYFSNLYSYAIRKVTFNEK